MLIVNSRRGYNLGCRFFGKSWFSGFGFGCWIVAGFVLGFVFYQPQIDKLQMETSTFKHQISVLQGQISSLNSQLNEANRRIRELGEAIGLWEDSKAIQIQAVSFTLHTATISVQNVGVSTVTINHIFIDGTPRISEPLTAVLTEGATAIFKVTIPNYFTHGREVTIRIVCTDGTFTEGKFIV